MAGLIDSHINKKVLKNSFLPRAAGLPIGKTAMGIFDIIHSYDMFVVPGKALCKITLV
jgi:hypothetical protein